MASVMRTVDAMQLSEAPRKGQLSLVTGGSSSREAVAERTAGGEGSVTPLAERLRAERPAPVTALASADGRTTVLRRGGEATLDELLVGAWEGLSAHRSVVCPVCRGTAMVPRRHAAGGACADCGVELR